MDFTIYLTGLPHDARTYPGFPFVFKLGKTHRVDVTHDFEE